MTEEDIERMAKAIGHDNNDMPWGCDFVDMIAQKLTDKAGAGQYCWRLAKIAREASHLPEQLATANKQLKEQDDQLKGMALDHIDVEMKLVRATTKVEELRTALKEIEVYSMGTYIVKNQAATLNDLYEIAKIANAALLKHKGE